MIHFNPASARILVHTQPTDMRKSFDGLLALSKNVMQADPLRGHLLVFFNRTKTMAKLLYFERGGFCIWHKQLEVGRFGMNWQQPHSTLTWLELQLLLEGADAHVVYRHKRLENPLITPKIGV